MYLMFIIKSFSVAHTSSTKMLSLRRPLLCGVRSGAWMRRVPRVEGRFGQGLRGLCSTSTGITITPRCAEVRERVRPPRHVCTIAPVPTLRVVSPPLGAHSRVCVCDSCSASPTSIRSEEARRASSESPSSLEDALDSNTHSACSTPKSSRRKTGVGCCMG